MNHIFISYRWGDHGSDESFEAFVKEIEKITGLTAFWDTRELRSGNFINKLQEGVKTADIFMPVVTESYLKFGKESGRDEDKDFCLLEYVTAVSAGKKIIPFFCGVDGSIKTVSDDEAKTAAQAVLNLSYTGEEISVLQKYLCSQNGVTVSQINSEQIDRNIGRMCSVVFDTFCSGESEIVYFKKHLEAVAAELDPVRIFGDFDDSGLTLGNSYIPLSFLRYLTKKEREEKESRKESTAPTNISEDDLLKDLEKERLAVIVGDAGQGKSSFVRHLTIQLAENADRNGLSRKLFFPLYFECKNIDRESMSVYDVFLNKLAEEAGFSRPAFDAVMRFGKPLFIFDAMDEVPPAQMDALIDAVYKHIYIHNDRAYFLFTSRPGQKLLSGNNDMTLSNDSKTAVRRYSVKEFDDNQQELYITDLVKAKRADSDINNTFLQALRNKEADISDYQSISRNPFMLFAIFSTYTNGQELPENRFDAISRVIDDVIERDLKKKDYSPIKKKNIKEVLGAVSCLFYHQRDMGKTPHASAQTPYDLAEKIYDLDDSDRDDRKLLNKYSDFFESSNLLDENGFRHEFLASAYAAYYLLFLMKSKVKRDKSPLEVSEISSLKKDADYWKGVTEALLCLIDHESEDSKTYLEPLIDELQNVKTPDYDTLCCAVSQFVNHQPRAAALLLSEMTKRGCDGIMYGEQTDSGFICRKGVNPYEELFYYPAIYPYLRQYLPNLTADAKNDAEQYLCIKLIREVCALFSDKCDQKLQSVYKSRSIGAYPDIIKKLTDAADRRGENIRGYVRIRDGETEIGKGAFFGCAGLTDITIPDSVTVIGECAFYDCSGLTSITIPDNVTEIGRDAFSGCTGLTGIIVGDNNPQYSSIDGVLFNKEKTAVIMCPRGKTGAYIIPDSVTEIGEWAFSHCKGLTDIIIPDSVTEIGKNAFSRCTGLTGIIVGDNNPQYSSIDGVLFNKEKTAVIAYPAGKTGAYIIPDSATEIGEWAFFGCMGLTGITIPDSVREIGESAFSDCKGLTGITIPDSVTEIGDYAFSRCTGLTSITIPDSVTVIGEWAFSGCKGLTGITIPDSVIEIGSVAFSGCTGLTRITIPDSVGKIGFMAFSFCTGLTDITIPDSVTEIEELVFYRSPNLNIHGQKGSCAEEYAKKNKIPFIAE